MNRYHKNIQSHNLKSMSTQNKLSPTLNQERRRAIDLSIQNNLNSRVAQITKANQKLLERLLDISERKKTPIPYKQQHKGRDLARIMKMKSIQTENIRLGTRLMNKGSLYDHNKMHKQMRDYEKLKKMMINNRKAGNDRILIPGSLSNPYELNCRKGIRKMKTQPIQDIHGESKLIEEMLQKSGSKNNILSSEITIQLEKDENNQQQQIRQSIQQVNIQATGK